MPTTWDEAGGYCLCGHPDTDHVNTAGHCRNRDDAGHRCPCSTFEPDPDAEDGDGWW